MPLIPYLGKMPKIADDVYIAEGAQVIGDVTIGAGTGIWYNTVIRGDIAPITIGRNCNIQDNVTLHVDVGMPLVIEDDVSVGHGAIVHGCIVRRGALVAIQAVVLTGAEIGEDSIVGTSAFVGEGKVIPPRSVAVGIPAKVVRAATEKDIASNASRVRRYAVLAREHRTGVPRDAETG
jgi:carbonic anhydrase/acetyltransferase-like protein (isoleucine patch superfamily)